MGYLETYYRSLVIPKGEKELAKQLIQLAANENEVSLKSLSVIGRMHHVE